MAELIQPTQPSEGHRRLSAWFLRRGKTMVALAEEIGVSVPTVHAWRHGHKTPRERFRIAIEAATEGAVRPDDWVTDKDRARIDGRAA